MDFDFVAVPAITVVCFLIAEIIKKITGNERVHSLLPAICGVCGAILGVVVFLTAPEMIEATEWPAALATGIVSGFAATGVHQIFKQADKWNIQEDGGDD